MLNCLVDISTRHNTSPLQHSSDAEDIQSVCLKGHLDCPWETIRLNNT